MLRAPFRLHLRGESVGHSGLLVQAHSFQRITGITAIPGEDLHLDYSTVRQMMTVTRLTMGP